MRASELLQVVYAFFLGLVVLAFVAIGLMTFYPSPDYPVGTPSRAEEQTFEATYSAWQLTTSIILLVAATAILVISLLRTRMPVVISNGLLLGGIFTMVYAVGMSLAADSSILRFLVATFALAVTVGVGYLTFRVRRTSADRPADDESLAGRVSALEERLDAVRRSLG